MTLPVFAADRTFLRLRDAGIASSLASVGTLNIEVICGHWYVVVRGAAGEKPRRWFSMEASWDDVQTEDDNPLLSMIEKVAAHLQPEQ